VRCDDGAGAFDVRERDRQNTLPRQWPGADYESFTGENQRAEGRR
jgi:hypothetical protein